MDFIKNIYVKIHCHFANLVLRKSIIDLPISLRNRKNIFLYFDYEREFGGHKTDICDKDIREILDVLDQYQLKATWFTVGKIFEHYPASINDILNRGHEIGSHTYSHIAPLKTPKHILNNDFKALYDVSHFFTEIKGFHAPYGKWSPGMLKSIQLYGFSYDIIGIGKSKKVNTFFIKLNTDRRLLRIYTIGDDWQLFEKNPSKEQAFYHFVNLYKKINLGQLGGIGFHPWVLVSDENIWEGFKMFLSYFTRQDNLNIQTATFYASEILIQNQLQNRD